MSSAILAITETPCPERHLEWRVDHFQHTHCCTRPLRRGDSGCHRLRERIGLTTCVMVEDDRGPAKGLACASVDRRSCAGEYILEGNPKKAIRPVAADCPTEESQSCQRMGAGPGSCVVSKPEITVGPRWKEKNVVGKNNCSKVLAIPFHLARYRPCFYIELM